MTDSSSSNSTKSFFHLSLAVSNIKNHICITLEMENVQYGTWAELFKIHAKSHRFLHHIIPPESGKEKVPKIDAEQELWSTLDATVLQWIYATISTDLFHTILELDSTTMDAWNRLRDIFQDNKNSRAITLEHEFSHTNMEDFPNASAYCQQLKILSDQLKNVGAPASNNRLVLQMVARLTEAYKGVGTLIRQSNPLPLFYQACSMLILEEISFTKQLATGSTTAMLLWDYDENPSSGNNHPNRQNNSGKKHQNSSNNGGKNCGRGGANRGSGSRNNGGFGGGRGSSTTTSSNNGSLGWEMHNNGNDPSCRGRCLLVRIQPLQGPGLTLNNGRLAYLGHVHRKLTL
ncbi:uncharacterized protein LOC132620178 [Lycium barbarum]|uniref:uncharacterized protein LOC132620178 n=1 Tax=Lycium barbarum TaxID=112863 RepID=UPI00293E5DCC|nr:uncharacterized protein LOC132620178 [Lycium barbarum]